MDRVLKISRLEFLERKKLLSDIMVSTYANMFFREGYIKGKSIIKKCGFPIDVNDVKTIMEFRKEFFKKVEEVIKEENLATHVFLKENIAVLTGSIESELCNKPNCHFMRGVLSKIYEIYHGERVICKEIECEGMNRKNCIFEIILTI